MTTPIDTKRLRRIAHAVSIESGREAGQIIAGAADHIDAQAAEIAEAKGQIEYLDRQNNALRDVLRSLADIDLAGPMPNDFAWFVLRARSALQESSHD